MRGGASLARLQVLKRMYRSPLLTPGNGFCVQAGRHDTLPADTNVCVDIPVPFLLHQLSNGPPQQAQTCKAELLSMYRRMYTIRRLEITADLLFKSQKVRGFCHLYDGQEAIAVGLQSALTYEDSVITAYRDHGIYLARGGTVFETLSELMGKRTGCAAGKGGSMHLYKKENNFYGGWGIVGTPPPLGAGIALAHKYQNRNSVVAAIYGDGAENQGQVYETKSMAALWNLPMIFLVENNHYGMGTAEQRASKKITYFDRVSYIPGIKVDGMDIFSVKQGLLFCKEHCMEGKGPIVMECDTYRYHGHSMSDPGSSYRTRDEIKGVRKARDPIEHLKRIILEKKIANQNELKDIDGNVKGEVEKSLKKSEEASPPQEEDLFTNFYKKDAGLEVYGCDRKHVVSKLP
eukprot:c22172_g1_i2 orf=226-1437(-)